MSRPFDFFPCYNQFQGSKMKYKPPWIPKDGKWYLADIIMEFKVGSDDGNTIHSNLRLVRADSPEEAYEKALLLGQESELIYDNLDGEKVTVRFRGLRDLYVIYDEFEHGAEILYTEYEDLSEDALTKMITAKEHLSIFAPREVEEDE
jgi:Domain of unknown function (DUF4288)